MHSTERCFEVVNYSYGEKDLLGQFLFAGADSGLVPSFLVGAWSDDSDRNFQLVAGVSQRLVLGPGGSRCPQTQAAQYKGLTSPG